MHRPIVAQANHIIERAAYTVQTQRKPSIPTMSNLNSNPYKYEWYCAIMECNTKNHRVGLFSIPTPRSSLPDNDIILRAVSTFKINKTDVAGIYEF